MEREYSALALDPLAPGARLVEDRPLERATLDDPAFSVMTDLREITPATITPERPIDDARATMIDRGVRLLFVLDAGSAVAGVITATDLLGEKPLRFSRERGVKRSEVLVADIMTPAAMLEAIPMSVVAQMRVGHIVATMQQVRRQHVMAADDDGRRVRGLFSASRIARQLGRDLAVADIATTFAEIEAALAH